MTVLKVSGGIAVVGVIGFGAYYLFTNIGGIFDTLLDTGKGVFTEVLDTGTGLLGEGTDFIKEQQKKSQGVFFEGGKKVGEGINDFLNVDLKKGSGTTTPKDLVGKAGSVIGRIGGGLGF